MLKKGIRVVTTVLVMLGMLGVAAPALAAGGSHVKGTVVAKNRRTHVVTVRNALGKNVKLKYNSTRTRLWHNGTRLGLSKLRVGNKVDASFTPKTGAPVAGVADDVEDDFGQYEVQGTVAGIDTTAGTVSIASEDGGSTVVLNVDSSTVITRNGSPAALGDLQFGDKVEAKYDSATMLASEIKAEENTEKSEFEGTITAVDAGAGTISISGQSQDDQGEDSSSQSLSPTDITLNVDGSTTILLDGSPAQLSALQIGFQVEAEYDPATMLASFIEAENSSEGD